MCEVHVFIHKEGAEEKFMESVERVEAVDSRQVRMKNIFGEEKTVFGKIILFDSNQNKILLQPV